MGMSLQQVQASPEQVQMRPEQVQTSPGQVQLASAANLDNSLSTIDDSAILSFDWNEMFDIQVKTFVYVQKKNSNNFNFLMLIKGLKLFTTVRFPCCVLFGA